jgi:hypothetical protein
MAQPARSRVQVLTYLVILFAFSSFFYFLILHSGSLGNGRGMYTLGLMYCPGLAGMLTLRLNGRSISELGWKWGETKYQIRSWYIPLLYATIAYAIVWIFRLGGFGNPEYYDSLVKSMHLGGSPWISIVLGTVLIGTYGVLRSVTSALGEEIGWRGFLVYHDIADQRNYLVGMALSRIDFQRLQRGDAHLVWIDLLHGVGRFHQFYFCVDAFEVRKLVDWGNFAWQPQPLYSGDFYAADAKHGQDGLVYRRVRLRSAGRGHRVCYLLLDETAGVTRAIANDAQSGVICRRLEFRSRHKSTYCCG